MVAVVSGELASPLFTGLIYCSVIDACREVYDLGRAGERFSRKAREVAAATPAYVEIQLAAGDGARVRSASNELVKIADDYGTRVLIALAAQAISSDAGTSTASVACR